jgi:type I restriction enzyme S subunit
MREKSLSTYKLYKISEVTNIRKQKSEVNSVPYIEIGDIDVTTKTYKIKGKKSVPGSLIAKKNDVIISRVRPTRGAVSIIESSEVCASSAFTILESDEKILPKYLFYSIAYNQNFFDFLGKNQIGTSYPSCREKDIINFKILVPSLNIQEKIVSILEQGEATIRLRKRIDELSNQLIPSVFLEMFGDPINNPKKWKLVTLESVCDEIYRYPTFYGFKYVSEGFPVLKISNMNDDGSFIDDLNVYDKITKEINEKYPRTTVKEGDIVMEARGTYIGTCALVSKNFIGANISPNTIRISPNRSKILPQFLLNLSFTKAWKTEIDAKVNYWKAGFGTIKSAELKGIKIPLPPLQFQNHFVTIIDNFKRMQQNQIHSRQEIDNLFKVLLQKTFLGELII